MIVLFFCLGSAVKATDMPVKTHADWPRGG